jgi:hypothetical protein
MIAKVAHTDFDTISTSIVQFEKHIKSQSTLDIVKLMKLVVPEYLSQNSIYEVLDNKNGQVKIREEIAVN